MSYKHYYFDIICVIEHGEKKTFKKYRTIKNCSAKISKFTEFILAENRTATAIYLNCYNKQTKDCSQQIKIL
jgi:hypothetical protein